MEDNCKKILLDKKYGLKKIERILKRHKFYESGNKDKLLESVSNNPTIFELIIIELLKKSRKNDVKKMCETLGIDSNSNVDELKKNISDKLKKNIKNKNIKNKIDFLDYAFDKPDLERILKRHKFPKSGNKDKLLEACVRNDFIVKEAMTKWKKSKKNMRHIQDMCETLGMDWEGKKGELLQKIEDYVFKNEIKKDIQNEITKPNSPKFVSKISEKDLENNFKRFSDYDMEELTGELFKAKGYTVEVSSKVNDQKIDVWATTKDGTIIGIQVKHWENNVGHDTVSEVLGSNLGKVTQYIIISTKAGFTKSAIDHQQQHNVIMNLWDSDKFKNELREHLINNLD